MENMFLTNIMGHFNIDLLTALGLYTTLTGFGYHLSADRSGRVTIDGYEVTIDILAAIGLFYNKKKQAATLEAMHSCKDIEASLKMTETMTKLIKEYKRFKKLYEEYSN